MNRINIESHINAIRVDCSQERADEIQRILAVEELEVKEDEKMQPSDLIEDYEDIFALHPWELGHTNVVQHTINTGDSAPLRQPARRIPFALALHSPNGITSNSYRPEWDVFSCDSLSMPTCQYPAARSNVGKYFCCGNESSVSSILGKGYTSFLVTTFRHR